MNPMFACLNAMLSARGECMLYIFVCLCGLYSFVSCNLTWLGCQIMNHARRICQKAGMKRVARALMRGR
jgi:hypothetical protein